MVQRMSSEVIETIVGVTQNPPFGPIIMFDLDGIDEKFIKEVAFKLHPLTDIDASQRRRVLWGRCEDLMR